MEILFEPGRRVYGDLVRARTESLWRSCSSKDGEVMEILFEPGRRVYGDLVRARTERLRRSCSSRDGVV